MYVVFRMETLQSINRRCTMNSTRMLASAFALALMAAPLAAQQSPEARIQAAMERAQASGLAVEVLESKLAEGLAKNVPMERIAVAIQNRARAMERAHAALQRAQRGHPSAADQAVGADAIEAGVSEVVLQRIAATAGAERRTVAIAALAYLVAEGQVPEAALARVEEALARGGPGMGDLQRMARGGHDRPGVGGPPQGVPATGRPDGAGPPDRPGRPPRN
jgi:hypothetical protein